MKAWRETSQIAGRLAELAGRGAQAALATVIDIDGSAYRRPGAKLLVEAGGEALGGVSGGCLEADVREVARAVVDEHSPRLLRYDMTNDDGSFGLGLGCRGIVDVFVQPATDHLITAVREIQRLLAGREAFAISTVVEGEGVGRTVVTRSGGTIRGSTGGTQLDRAVASLSGERLGDGGSGLDTLGGARVFTEVLAPPPDLVVFGAGDDSVSLAACAWDVGFRVTVVDHRAAALEPQRFPEDVVRVHRRPGEGVEGVPLHAESYVVLKLHSLDHDRAWLEQILRTPAPYVGVLGPRARTAEMLAAIGAPMSERIFAPVGIDLAAEGAEQVALSIVAELLAVRSGRAPTHLREKRGAIHVD